MIKYYVNFRKILLERQYNMTINVQHVISVSHKDRKILYQFTNIIFLYFDFYFVKEGKLVGVFVSSVTDSTDDVTITEFWLEKEY